MLLDKSGLNKLRWRCRRGMLENDIFIERFLNKYEHELTLDMTAGLMALMDLSDPELLDLFLGRVQPEGDYLRDSIFEVLGKIRTLNQ
jgi:antitoxin CptB